ncbi:MAG: hypothetical protein LBC38_04195, partial [Oscillospiraceae bacterium]|nr:hypothetical protein [Oscillospiraceae bacterium]
MKRILAIALILLLSLSLLVTVACSSNTNTTTSNEPPTIPNEPPQDFITIKGEEYSTELTELYLSDQELSDADIEPLRYMTNLTHLALNGNSINNISPLA